MKKTKRCLEPFTFLNTTAICARLEKMAAKGWMLEKITNTRWIYRKTEPKKLRFAVSYYPKASEYDPEPSEGQQVFLDFCAHTGWVLACTASQMQIFYNERENPVPIETEPSLEVQSITASAKKTLIPSLILQLVIGGLYGGIFLMALLGNPIATLANTSQIFAGICSLSLMILGITELTCYFSWKSRAVQAAENGTFLPPPNTAPLQKGILAVVTVCGVCYFADHMINGDNLRRWILLAMCVYMPVLFFLVNATKEFLKRRKASRGLNRGITVAMAFVAAFAMVHLIIYGTIWAQAHRLFDASEETYEHNGMTWVIHNDTLPLTLEELIQVEPESYIRERNGSESLLLGNFRLRQYPRFDIEADLPELEYRMVFVKWPALYRVCQDRLFFEQHGAPCQPEDPTAWGAREAYRFPEEESYLLCYDGLLIELELDWEPTQEQKIMIGRKLSGQ